ncbi:LysR family transcriptional regulator [Noviherbaspirillum aerium]|uniref:LysR family transcriptional regulator n=1 Tax=Noviherbaspirillum aerium TaxID=2588497 RepID=UPI00298FBC94|nr:LysR family transcriptional regulator [Noviherbaspirillum aerium]
MMNISMRDLRAFVALAEQRNFTRAAEQCHLSQSAFSALIQGLEDELGVKLFARSTRRVEMTAEGKVFADSANRLLGEFALVQSEMKDHVEKRKGRVSVAALPSLAAGWLPVVIKEFRASYPGVSTELADTLSDECLELVRAGRADFALCAAGADMAGLEAEPLCTDEFYVVMHREHALARRKTLSAHDLQHQPFIHLSHTSSVRQLLDAALHPGRIAGIMEVAHLASVASLVGNNIGISVIPFLALFQFSHPDLVIRPLKEPKIVRTIYVVRQGDRPLSVAAEAFLGLLKKRRSKIRSELGKDERRH